MRQLCALLVVLIILHTSCVPVLKRTLGKHLYKKDFLPNPIPKDAEFYTKIPYEFRDGWTIIKVKINNSAKAYNFIFDTGARCFISDSIVKELKLYPTRYKKSWDTNGSVSETGLYKIGITIGDFHLSNVGALSKKSFDNLSNNCYPIDGIIGMNVLNQGIFHFNSEAGELHITNSIDKIPESQRGDQFRLITHEWSGQSFVKMKVNNQKGRFLFDTGSANLLFVKQEKRNNLTPIKRRVGYIGGLHSTKQDTFSFYKIEHVSLGEKKLERLNGDFAISYKNAENNLGNGILKKYNVTLDRKEKRLYLSSNGNETENVTSRISNLQLDWESGKVLVSSLAIGSELQTKGLTLGDTITFINDVKMDSFKDYCSFEAFKDSLLVDINAVNILLKVKRGAIEKEYIVTDKLLYE